MSDTPETDAAIKAQAEWRRPFISYTMDGVTWDGPVADLCRRLERERDEARNQRDAWEKVAILNAEKLGCLLFGKVEEAK